MPGKLKLSVVRGGGLAGIVRRTELRSEALPADEARALRERVERAGVFTMPESPAPHEPHPDEMHYELTVEEEGGRRRTVRLSESTMPEEVRGLIEWADSVRKRGGPAA